MVVPYAGHVEVIGVDRLGTKRRRLLRSAAAQRPGGQAADQHQADAPASFHERLTPSTKHRGGNNDAHPKYYRTRDDCRRNVTVLQDFPVEMSGGAFVEDLVPAIAATMPTAAKSSI